ncbi:MAG: bifunctional diaminohydroxyphosphoribosylaminopyrimidine deaminase/5-amino-6-(5-phosphoribosylamino)uracil reductase RibD [Woeseiaceae bacterium]|nr:bifunctional diaminohydroxyphosphoribosylaminopyrimidine deaminase/5-amino-6-(5-phosphoribosylamino)uracil reductase RibD [Woeseiaceae bacterium]
MSETSRTGFDAADSGHMARALQLAWRGRYTAHPNPRVGCVLVRDGRVIGEGWHQRTGESHAEVNALAAAGGEAKGATAYVTLEPCSHHGKTPPCSDALIAAGVAEVVVAMQDPFAKVAGSGLKALQKAGVAVRIGHMATEAAKLNEGFISRVARGRPFVRLKMAASLDGCTAMSDGQSQWITGAESRADVQRLRAASGAVMTGVGTVMADDPSLTVSDKSLTDLQPLRVIVDSRLRMPTSACMLALPGRTAIFCIDDSRRQVLETAGATVHKCTASDGRVDLAAVLRDLAKWQINDVLVEAGRHLGGSLLGAGLVDEIVIYQAPHIMGSETRGMFLTPQWQKLEQRLDLDIIDVRKFGRDTRIIARPVRIN